MTPSWCYGYGLLWLVLFALASEESCDRDQSSLLSMRAKNRKHQSCAGAPCPDEVRFDAHNHVGGSAGWWAYPMAYLMAAKDQQFMKHLADIDSKCDLKPEQYGRESHATASDVCLYQWIRKYLYKNGDLYSNVYLPAFHYVANVTAEVLSSIDWDGYIDNNIERQLWCSHTAFPLLRCIQDAWKSGDIGNLVEMLTSVLSSSPLIDFDSAYVAKEEVLVPLLLQKVSQRPCWGSMQSVGEKPWTRERERSLRDSSDDPFCRPDWECPEPPYECPQGQFLVNYWLYTLNEVKIQGTTWIQWSHPHFLMPVENCSLNLGSYLPASFSWMVSTCEMFEPLHWLIFNQRIEAVSNITFHFNPMYVSKVFAALAGPSVQPQPYGITSGVPGQLGETFTSTADGGVGILGWPMLDLNVTANYLDLPHINGIDFASPEYNVYDLVAGDGEWTWGGHFLKTNLELVLEKATKHNKRMFVHIHVGEGFGVFDYRANGLSETWLQPCDPLKKDCLWARGPDFSMSNESYQSLCTESSKSWSLQKRLAIKRLSTGEPVHYANARKNLKALLQGIKKFREEHADLPLFDSWVVIYFGHSTHADLEVAETMSSLGVWTDVDLVSNLATGALTSSPEAYEQSDMAFPLKYLDGLAMSTNNGAWTSYTRELYEDYGLKYFLKSGTCFTHATDGSGLEHSSLSNSTELASTFTDMTVEQLNKLNDDNTKIVTDFLSGKRESHSC